MEYGEFEYLYQKTEPLQVQHVGGFLLVINIIDEDKKNENEDDDGQFGTFDSPSFEKTVSVWHIDCYK